MNLDRLWQEIKDLILENSFSCQEILLPYAEWRVLDRNLSFYANSDQVDIKGYSCVVVHKAMLGSFSLLQLDEMLSDWITIFGNAVFVVFARKKTTEYTVDPKHLDAVKVFVDPRHFWRENYKQACFLHIPKTAGTSVWTALSVSISSKAYFSSDESLLNYAGDINDFEVVGGHFNYDTLRETGWNGPVFTTIRDPISRLYSFARHAWRDRAYIQTLDQNFKVMLEVLEGKKIGDPFEIVSMIMNGQTLAIGASINDDLLAPITHAHAFANALNIIEVDDFVFSLSEDGADMLKEINKCFGVDLVDLPNKNSTDHTIDIELLKSILIDMFFENRVTFMDTNLYPTLLSMKKQ